MSVAEAPETVTPKPKREKVARIPWTACTVRACKDEHDAGEERQAWEAFDGAPLVLVSEELPTPEGPFLASAARGARDVRHRASGRLIMSGTFARLQLGYQLLMALPVDWSRPAQEIAHAVSNLPEAELELVMCLRNGTDLPEAYLAPIPPLDLPVGAFTPKGLRDALGKLQAGTEVRIIGESFGKHDGRNTFPGLSTALADVRSYVPLAPKDARAFCDLRAGRWRVEFVHARGRAVFVGWLGAECDIPALDERVHRAARASLDAMVAGEGDRGLGRERAPVPVIRKAKPCISERAVRAPKPTRQERQAAERKAVPAARIADLVAGPSPGAEAAIEAYVQLLVARHGSVDAAGPGAKAHLTKLRAGTVSAAARPARPARTPAAVTGTPSERALAYEAELVAKHGSVELAGAGARAYLTRLRNSGATT